MLMTKKITAKRPQNKNKTSFEVGNKSAEKWTIKEATEVFEVILTKGRKKTCQWLSMQEAVLDSRAIIPHRTFYYLLEKFPVLQFYKKELNDIILSKINKGALLGDLTPAPAIWRMKQLGETDKQEVDVTSTNLNATIELTDKQKAEAIERVKKGLAELEDYE